MDNMLIIGFPESELSSDDYWDYLSDIAEKYFKESADGINFGTVIRFTEDTTEDTLCL